MPEATPRQSRLTLLIGATAVIVATAFVFGVRDKLLENWYLSRLESKDAATRHVAVERLGELGSLRAFPWLTNAARNCNLYILQDGTYVTDC